jgi:hypothetical protein
MRLYDSSRACAADETQTSYAVVYSSTSFVASPSTIWYANDILDLTTATAISRFIAVPYSNATTTTPSLTISWSNGSSNCSKSQVLITNASGKVLTVSSACQTTVNTLTATDSASIGGSGSFFILYTRVSDTAGALRVWSTSLSK